MSVPAPAAAPVKKLSEVKVRSKLNRRLNRILTFPFEIIKYAGRGVSFIFNSIVAPDKIGSTDPNRLEGIALEEELIRVKEQSTEFKNKAVTQTVQDSRKEMNFKFEAQDDYGNRIKGKFDAPSVQEAINFLKTQYDELISIEEL